MFYVVFEYDKRSKHSRVLDFYLDAESALNECDSLNSSKIRPNKSYFVKEVNSFVFTSLVDKKLIECCKFVGMCLSLMDAQIRKKGKLNNALSFYERAIEACKRGAKYLD